MSQAATDNLRSLDEALKDDAAKLEPEKKPKSAPRRASLEKRLSDMLVSMGTAVAMADQTCGLSIVAQGPEVASALDALARDNTSVRRGLEKLLTGGAWGGVFLAVSPVLSTVLAHHRVLPEQYARLLGIEPKPPKKSPKSPESPSPEVIESLGDVVTVGTVSD